MNCENCARKGNKTATCSSGSNETFGAWGMSKETCRNCYGVVMDMKRKAFFDKRRKAAQQGRQQDRLDEEIIRSAVNCNVGENECIESYLQCTKCDKFSHPECNGDLLLVLQGGEAAYNIDRQRELRQNFVCVKCVAAVKDDASQNKHFILAEQVARINANRVAAVASARSQTLGDKWATSDVLYEKHRPLLKAVIQWACQRVAWIADQQMPALNRALYHTPMLSEPLTTPHWDTFVFRARRFLVMWRHKGLSDSNTKMLSRRFMYKGLGPTGEELEPASLYRVASMAASFIAITQRELDAVFYNNRERMTNFLQSQANIGGRSDASPNLLTMGNQITGSPFIPVPQSYPAHEEMHPIISDLMMDHLYHNDTGGMSLGKKTDKDKVKDKDVPSVLTRLPSHKYKFRVKPMSVPPAKDKDSETGIGYQERSIFLLLVQMVDALLVPCMSVSSTVLKEDSKLSKRKRESQAVLPEVEAAIAKAKATKVSKHRHNSSPLPSILVEIYHMQAPPAPSRSK